MWSCWHWEHIGRRMLWLPFLLYFVCDTYQGGCNAFFDLGPRAKNGFWCEGFCWQELCMLLSGLNFRFFIFSCGASYFVKELHLYLAGICLLCCSEDGNNHHFNNPIFWVCRHRMEYSRFLHLGKLGCNYKSREDPDTRWTASPNIGFFQSQGHPWWRYIASVMSTWWHAEIDQKMRLSLLNKLLKMVLAKWDWYRKE